MSEYPKTENLYARDDATHKLTEVLKRTDFGQVDRWFVTEKIDGTNIRLVFQRMRLGEWTGQFHVRGRSDAAALPKNFVEEACAGIDYDRMSLALAAIDETGKADAMVVFGEGYGPGIQKGGGDYATRKSLRIFDAVTYLVSEDGEFSRGLWRTWEDVEAVARTLGLKTVPVLGEMLTDRIVHLVESDPISVVAYEERVAGGEYTDATVLRRMEGVVARTDPYLFDYRGNRVLWKLKHHDLPQ